MITSYFLTKVDNNNWNLHLWSRYHERLLRKELKYVSPTEIKKIKEKAGKLALKSMKESNNGKKLGVKYVYFGIANKKEIENKSNFIKWITKREYTKLEKKGQIQ